MSNKRALLIGINYKGTSAELAGCVNDCNNIYEVLTTKLGYLPENITMVKEEDGFTQPTKANIISELNKLVTATTAEGSQVNRVFVSYSGHGSYDYDRSGDERDNRDELLIPMDYQSGGVISDDQLNGIFKKFPSTVQVFGLFDCCHSSSVLDLRYRYIGTKQNYRENQSSVNLASNIVTVSGCKDSQTSADAFSIDNSGEWSGALTTSFLTITEKHNYKVRLYVLIKEIREYLKKRSFTQIPQICCTDPLNYLSEIDFNTSTFNYRTTDFQKEERRRRIIAQRRRRQRMRRRNQRRRGRRRRPNRRRRPGRRRRALPQQQQRQRQIQIQRQRQRALVVRKRAIAQRKRKIELAKRRKRGCPCNKRK